MSAYVLTEAIFTLNRNELIIENLGLTLAGTKDLLKPIRVTLPFRT
ncbi:hypothetical protein BH09BAC4_BH09BAC4_21200 [soil metagenome]